eukprot:3474671-Amphidinium_carterae.2
MVSLDSPISNIKHPANCTTGTDTHLKRTCVCLSLLTQPDAIAHMSWYLQGAVQGRSPKGQVPPRTCDASSMHRDYRRNQSADVL